MSRPSGTPLDLLETRPTVTVSEAATILSISRGQAYAMARSGELRSIRIGTRIVVPTEQLRRLIGESEGSVDQQQGSSGR